MTAQHTPFDVPADSECPWWPILQGGIGTGASRRKSATATPHAAPDPAAPFDVSAEPLPPASLTYDWVSKHLGVAIKRVWEQGEVVPRVRVGDFLLGLESALAARGAKTDDVRNLSGDSERPPVYESVRLCSTLSHTFLVEGMSFRRADFGPLVLDFSKTWGGGLAVTCYTAAERSGENGDLFARAWRWADENNHLRGEAFSLGGEFLPRTSDGWDDVFLEEENKSSLKRTCDLFNEKGAAFANRGVILTGPPGTGKTLSGRILRNQAKGTFVWISARDFHESGSYGGIRFGFRTARDLAPSVLFVEDVDNWLDSYTVDLVKTEMDGISRSSGVLTVLTTNFPEHLPAALIDRPGRFHDVLHFALPTGKARADMLAKWLPDLDDAGRADAVARTDGMSGAHVYELAHFARTLNEHDGLPLGEAVSQALAKVEEQRKLIGALRSEGGDNRPRRRAVDAATTPRPAPTAKSWAGLAGSRRQLDGDARREGRTR